MIRLFVLLALVAAVLPQQTRADVGVISAHVPQAELVGQGRLKYLAWNVYDGALYAPQGDWRADRPFGLSLRYLRSFTSGEIVDSTISEIRKQGFRDTARLDAWQKQLAAILPNVSAGTTLTGIRDAKGHAVFYRNASPLGTIRDRDFARRFFDIWLGGKTSVPSFRAKLIGAGS